MTPYSLHRTLLLTTALWTIWDLTRVLRGFSYLDRKREQVRPATHLILDKTLKREQRGRSHMNNNTNTLKSQRTLPKQNHSPPNDKTKKRELWCTSKASLIFF
jgi:hypothetical protein